MRIFLGVIFLAGLTAAAKLNYDGFSVYRLLAKTTEQSDLLHGLEEDTNLDFWTDPNRISMPVDVMVGPEYKTEFLRKMTDAGIEHNVYIEDVDILVKNEERESQLAQHLRDRMGWKNYYNLGQIYTWLKSLPEQYPGKVTIQVGGSTHEKREILGVKISFGEGRKGVFIEGGIHAREWISPATATYLINEILTSQDPDFRKIAESFDWYVFPVTNPDGYEFTHNGARLWRKTRSRSSVFCYGTDPNRNWDIHWRAAGTSSSPCAENYGGASAFSEIETKTLSQYISTIGENLFAYISFHSYSQLLLIPYGHTTKPLDNYQTTVKIGRKAINALASRYGTKYVVGNVAETIYPASGSSADWVKDKFKTPIVYTYELRDRGTHGFVLPPSQIVPNCLEVMDSLKVIFDEAAKEGLYTLA